MPSTGLIILSGPSGSGKSTLLNMIAVCDTDYVGKITYLNQAISTDAIGFIYQDFNLISKLSVYDNVRLSGVHDHDIIVDTLTDLGILDLMNQDADTCSGGEKQRVAIARALIRNPQIILADEPTGSLDHENSENIMTLLKNISKDRLVIVSSHDPAHLSIADQIITFNNESLVHTSKYETQAIPSTFTLRPFELNLALYAKITKQIRRKTTVLLSLLVMVSSIVLLLSINTQNLFNQSIKSFQDKNHQYRSFFTYYDDDLLINLE